MSALEELHRGLALAHAAVALEQDPLAIDLHQNPVDGAPLPQMNVEGGRQRRREGGSIDGGAHEGGVVFFGRLNIFRQGLHPVGQDEQGDLVGQKPVDALHPLVIAQAAEIIILRLADDLDVGGVKIFKKARQGQGRPGDRPTGNEKIQIILRAIDGLQPELAHQLVELHRIIAHALSPVL